MEDTVLWVRGPIKGEETREVKGQGKEFSRDGEKLRETMVNLERDMPMIAKCSRNMILVGTTIAVKETRNFTGKI